MVNLSSKAPSAATFPDHERSVHSSQSTTSAVGQHDCMGCRLTGGIFGVFGSAFMASALLQTPAPTGAHRAGIIVVAGATFAFGMFRAFA